MRGRRRSIDRRKRFFLDCEGESEQSYGAFLNRLADENGLKVHIVVKNLQPAGNPLVLVEKAVQFFAKEDRKAKFAGKAILLDADKLEELPEIGRRARELIGREGFTAIWQRPDHEGFLLKHFAGCERLAPPRGRSMDSLHAQWPEYQKNMSASDLQNVLTLEHVRRAASVIPQLNELLQMVGLDD